MAEVELKRDGDWWLAPDGRKTNLGQEGRSFQRVVLSDDDDGVLRITHEDGRVERLPFIEAG